MRATSENTGGTASAGIAAGNTRQAALRAGGVAAVIAGLGGIIWFTLELLPPVLGFDDTDNPAVSLDYLRQYPQFYPLAGVVLFTMASRSSWRLLPSQMRLHHAQAVSPAEA